MNDPRLHKPAAAGRDCLSGVSMVDDMTEPKQIQFSRLECPDHWTPCDCLDYKVIDGVRYPIAWGKWKVIYPIQIHGIMYQAHQGWPGFHRLR